MLQFNSSSKCPFCSPNDLSTRLVDKWEGVHLVSDAHPVVYGHLLGVAEAHHLSFGELDIAALSKLRLKIIETSKLLSGVKSKVILFERGNRTMNVTGNPSVDHAHFHLIPTEDVVLQLPATKKKADFLELPSYVATNSYYFYWDIFDDIAYWGDSQEVSSQFIRKIVSSANGLTDWNWRDRTSDKNSTEEHSNSVKALLERKRDEK